MNESLYFTVEAFNDEDYPSFKEFRTYSQTKARNKAKEFTLLKDVELVTIRVYRTTDNQSMYLNPNGYNLISENWKKS